MVFPGFSPGFPLVSPPVAPREPPRRGDAAQQLLALPLLRELCLPRPGDAGGLTATEMTSGFNGILW